MADRTTRVLLVEDNASDAELVLHQLKVGGIECEHRTASSARAVKQALQEPWDVILADYNLPGFTALDVRRWMREADIDIPIIVVTGMVGEETAARCVVEGCVDYLLKDRLTRLPQAVSRALAERQTWQEKREAEARLRDSERRFRALIENSVDMVTLVDPDGRIVYNAGSSILGHDLQSRIGRSSAELLHPEDKQTLATMLERLRAAPGKVLTVEFRALHRDGSWRWIQSAAVNFLHEPAVGAVVFNSRDVTERRATQEALSQHSERLQVVNQALRTYLTDADLDAAVGSVLDHLTTATASAAAFTAVPRGKDLEVHVRLAGRAGVDLVHHAASPTLLRRLVDEGRGLHCDDASTLGEATGLPPECDAQRVVALPIRTGEVVIGLLGVVNWPAGTSCREGTVDALAPTVGNLHDIHARAERQRLLERELNQAMKMEAVGRLAGGVAHDFNNLLTAVLGFGEIAVNSLAPDDPVRGSLKEVLDAGQRASKLTRQLLTFSRREVVKPEPVDLSQVVGNMAKLLRRVIGEDIELIIAPGSTGEILADPGQIEQVVMNLAVNARDAMPHGGRLEIRSRDVDGTSVCLCVRDNGCGMTADIVAHIFEPFFTTKEQGRGTGLGLPTIYGIVQQAGGRIDVDTAPGKGTTFSICFPRLAASSSSPQALLERDGELRGSETVMVVEDADAVRRLTRAVLEGAGYHVLDAADGRQALRLLADLGRPIDLLLTDVVMPEMSGRRLADEVQQVRPGLPVVYMSGYTDDAVLRCGISQGEVPFIQKPFMPRALLAKVKEVLHPAEVHAAAR